MGETFYDAQRRHRRAGWRFTVLAFLAVVITNLPVAMVVSPPFAAATVIATDVGSLALPLPDLLPDMTEALADDGDDPGASAADDDRSVSPRQVLILAGLALVPGLLVVLAAWLTVRRLFLRAGPEAVVLAAGARPPRVDDLEEKQLVNLVEEMAIAAGVRPPQVRILDSEVANAAIVGRSVDDAIVVVPRGLLSQIGRRPTGAVVADLLASAVNGDLRVALSLAATTQTIDLLSSLLAAPTSSRARRTLWSLTRTVVRRRPPPPAAGPGAPAGSGGPPGPQGARQREAHFIVDELVALTNLEDLDDEEATAGWRVFAILPAMIARLALAMVKLIIFGMFVSPFMALLWRRRRLLADATAVELTRDPDALIEALEHLQARGASVPAGPWTHLFIVGPELEADRRQRRMEEQQVEVARQGRRPGESQRAAFARRHRARRAARDEYIQDANASTYAAGGPGGPGGPGSTDADVALVSYLPSIEKRIERLTALGGTRSTAPYRRQTTKGLLPLEILAYGALVVVLLPIVVVLLALLLPLVLGMALMAVLVESAVLAPLVVVVHGLTR